MIRRRHGFGSVASVAVIFAAFLCIAASDAIAQSKHRFTLDTRQWDQQPGRVNLAGSFNGWSRDASPMVNDAGVWSIDVTLNDGVHFYKFVIDGDRWINDPAADKELEQPDGHGGNNSAVMIGPDGRKLPPPEHGAINMDGVSHDPQRISDVNVASEQLLRLSLRVQSEDVTSVAVVWRAGTDDWKKFSLHPAQRRLGLDTFGTLLRIEPAATVQYYFEIMDGSAVKFLSPAGGVDTETQARSTPFSVVMKPTFTTPEWTKHAVWYQIFAERFRNGDPTNDPGDFWYENLVPWTSNWWATLPGEATNPDNFYIGAGNVWKRRYGGDLKGVQDKLPYLRSLGVNAIYFNPIFEAESMHKYDTADFRHIDDNFGVRDNPTTQPIGKGSNQPPTPYRRIGNQKLYTLAGEEVPADHVETDDPATWRWTRSDLMFLEFVQEARRQGFRIVLDGVFNHVGRAHPYFQDVLENGKNSRYADWFDITDWGDPAHWRKMDDPLTVHGKPGGIQWRAWDQVNGHLPVFRKDDKLGLAKGPYDHIMNITRRWLDPNGDGDPSDGIDGWRLDVPGDIPHPFWIEWRKLVKSVNPDAYITGEIWDWAQPWLKGDQFDAVMNYQFAMPVQAFFVNRDQAISPSQFNDRMNRVVYEYSLQVALSQQNLFDSHDTDRIASMFVNPDRPYDGANRPQDNARNWNPPYSMRKPNDEEWSRMKQAVAFQMTFLGAPMIYYGNEAGMWSADDPSNRQPMTWEDLAPYDDPEVRFNEDIFRFHQRTIAIRHRFEALRVGFFRSVLVDDGRGIYGFARELNGEAVYVILNRSSTDRTVVLPIGETHGEVEFLDWLNPNHVELLAMGNAADARPTLRVRDSARGFVSDAGNVTIPMKAYDTVILTVKPN